MPSGHRRLALSLLAFCITASHTPLAAQQTSRETQVPIDPERGVVEVGSDLRRELGLFPGVDGFQAARLFRREDGGLVLEVSHLEGGRLVRERRRYAEGDLAALRTELADRLATRGRDRAVEREGRSGLVLAESLLGLGFYGWAIPQGLDIDSTRGALASYLLTAGLSFYLPYRITRGASVTVAERNAAIWGATRGIGHGLLLGEVLTGIDADTQGSPELLAAVAMSVAETALAYQIVGATGASEGEVAFWNAAGDFGFPYGFGLSFLLGLYDGREVCDFDVCSVSEFEESGRGHAATLAFALASPVLAHLTGLGERYTLGDARALRSFGLLGAQLALPLAWAAFEDSDGGEKPFAASLLVGSAAGLWLGDRALAKRSLSGGDGLLVLAGHVAGGLGALGVTYLLDGGDREDDLLYLGTSALGSAAGALLTLRAVSGAPVSEAARSEGAGSIGGPRERPRFSLELTPGAAILPLVGGSGGLAGRAPLLTLRF